MHYRVRVYSQRGMREFYTACVYVDSLSYKEAAMKAIKKLTTGIFRNRGFNAWVVEKIEARGK